MGMYTELVVGIRLKFDTPKEVLDILDYMTREVTESPIIIPDHAFFKTGRWNYMFVGSSYYLPVTNSHSKFWRKDKINKRACLSVRCSFKNYDNEVNLFFDWIRPYVPERGEKTFMGYSLYEEDENPRLYYRDETL